MTDDDTPTRERVRSPVTQQRLDLRGGIVLALAGAALGGNFWHTFRNRNTWPWCSYNMFSYHSRPRRPQLRVAVHDAQGTMHGPVDPWGLLPVEFFRVVSALDKVLITNQDEQVRADFCARTVALLNDVRWRDFDEVRASLEMPSGAPIAALDLYLVEVDDRACDPRDRAAVLSASLLHRHDPDGVAHVVPDWRIREAAA